MAVVLLALSVIGTQLGSADSFGQSDEANWQDQDVGAGLYVQIPGSDGHYGPTPAQPVSDPYIYEARFACTDGDFIAFPACAEVIATCSTGGGPDNEPGTAIYWYRAFAGITPPVWTFHSGPFCVYDEKPRDLLAEIAELIAHEFQQTPVAPAVIGSQPGPHTLRGEETNVWAEATTQTFNISMLGQNVTITAVPVAYTWDYGDGNVWGPTPSHGAPLHADRIGEQTQTSHVYTTTGQLAITLTTHFDGTYTVNGGPQLPIPGQGNIPSAPLALTVWRAETNLYAENCFQNPNGIGC